MNRLTISIARVSTEDQAKEDRTSLATQLAENRAWADRYGYTIIDEIREEGVSVKGRFSPENPRPFWGAYSRLQRGEVDAIIFWRASSLSRDTHPMRPASVIVESREYGTGIVFADSPPPTPDDPNGAVFAFFNSLTSSTDAKNRWEATTRGVSGAFAKGRKGMGSDPLGRRWNKAKGTFDLVPEEVPVVRRILGLLANGMGATRASKQLTIEGIPTPAILKGWTFPKGTQGGWSDNMIRRVVEKGSHYATGIYERTYLGVTYTFQVEPIVDLETLERAQAQLRAGRPPIKGPTPRGLLQGRMVCGLCGAKYWTDSRPARGSGWKRGGETEAHYACGNRYRRAGRKVTCDHSPMWLARDIDPIVWKAVVRLLQTEGAASLVAARIAQLEAQIADAGPTVGRLTDELAALEVEQQRAIKLAIRVGTDIEPELDRIAKRRTEVTTALAGMNRERRELDG